MKTPEVRIYFSNLLYDKVSKPLDRLFATPELSIESPETYKQYAENYRNEWAKYQDKILPALVEILGVEFYRDVIDAPCAMWVHSISDPLILSFSFFPDQFVDLLTHELCHILLTDNTSYSMRSSPKEAYMDDRWKNLFGEEHDFTTVIHIPVHALCKYIYLDVLKEPSRLERDIEDVKDNAPYKAAWDYVNGHDYQEIIRQLREDYQQLKAELA